MHVEPQAIARPSYERPPVVETVLGLQFDRLVALTNAHLGVFWKSLDRQRWPIIEDATPLPNQFERFEDAARWGAGFQVQLSDDPAARCRIKNRNGDRMVQLQNTRLHLNWIGDSGGEYPRHETMLAEFATAFRSFSEFVNDENVGRVKPNQWEITYVNHIPQGTVWKAPEDWSFFKLMGSPTTVSLARSESFNGEWHLLIPEDLGRLHIQWQHAKKPSGEPNADDFIRLVFTARGPLKPNDDPFDSVLAGLNLGRDVIVTSFHDLVSKEANDYWGLQHAE